MGTIRAVFENGVFRPITPVQLPEACHVEFEPRLSAGEKGSPFVSDPQLTFTEFEAILDRMAARPGGHSLPDDFSRADIYDDHD